MEIFSWNTLIAAVLGIFIGWLIIRNKNTDTSRIVLLNEEEFKNNMRKGQLIDIRKETHYKEGTIKGARNFKPKEMTSKYTKLRRDLPVYLFCNNGRKSKRIAKKLVRDNYKIVYVLKNGYKNLSE
ncbi:MAG: rhodanese-like domain-containing protein [Candidatus Izimaplasma sp.]|nr:rhodanese-like domain-containing protein [Candidatus Izimaplasma bacterium]